MKKIIIAIICVLILATVIIVAFTATHKEQIEGEIRTIKVNEVTRSVF